MSQQITISDSQKFGIGPITGVDKKGNPTPLAGTPTFTSSDESLLTVEDHGDNTATVSAVGPLGNAQIIVQVTDDTAVIDVTIIAGEEVGLTVALGTPVEQE